MSLENLVERLDQRFRLLPGAVVPPWVTVGTLEATITWSYDLLNHAERTVLRRLSVFSGSFDLEAAEAICSTGSLETFEVDDLIGSLVGKSPCWLSERPSP